DLPRRERAPPPRRARWRHADQRRARRHLRPAAAGRQVRTVARYLMSALRSEGISTVFLVPGGSIDLFLPEYEAAGLRPVTAAHEAGAAFMADGYGRATGGFGVAMGVAGPGITNMTTALATAYADRTQLLVMTGSLPYAWRGRQPFQDATPRGVSD